MRSVVVVAVVASLAAPRPALADDPAALIREGEALAKGGEFAAAIDRFKRADRIASRAELACKIGLTYLRLARAPQAELFLRRCRARATADDPMPAWIADAERQVADQFAATPHATVDLRVLPPGTSASIVVSTFAADEPFEPQVIRMPLGRHVLTVRADGLSPRDMTLDITQPGSQVVEITLERLLPVETSPATPTTPVGPTTPVRPAPIVTAPAGDAFVEPDAGRRQWANRAFVAAGVAGAGAIALHVLAYRARKRLDNAETPAEYRMHESAFDFERVGTFSLYGVAALVGGIGLYLRLSERDTPVRVDATVGGGGASITLGWTR